MSAAVGWALIAAAVLVTPFVVCLFRREDSAGVQRPPVVWDVQNEPWDLMPNGHYQLRSEHGAFLTDWPLDAVDRVFGPISTDPREEVEAR